MQEKKNHSISQDGQYEPCARFFYVKWIAYTYCNHHISPLHMKIMMKIDIYKIKKIHQQIQTDQALMRSNRAKYIYMNCSSLNGIFFDCCFYFSSFYRFCFVVCDPILIISPTTTILCNSTFSLRARTRHIFFFLIFNYFGQHNRIILCIFLRSSAQQHSLWFRLLGI